MASEKEGARIKVGDDLWLMSLQIALGIRRKWVHEGFQYMQDRAMSTAPRAAYFDLMCVIREADYAYTSREVLEVFYSMLEYFVRLKKEAAVKEGVLEEEDQVLVGIQRREVLELMKLSVEFLEQKGKQMDAKEGDVAVGFRCLVCGWESQNRDPKGKVVDVYACPNCIDLKESKVRA